MATVNAVTIYAENLHTAAIVAGNSSSSITIVSNSVSINVGSNVSISTDEIRIGNSSVNTVINTNSISVSSLTLNGVNYSSIVPSLPLVDYQEFTNPLADNKWYKPSWAKDNDLVTIMMWGGGGRGSTLNGGGGGACVIVNKLAGELNSVCNVAVGEGGILSTSENGKPTIFYTNSTFSVTAYGGGEASSVAGGGGGGWLSAGIPQQGGGPVGGNAGVSSTFGGGGGGRDTGSAGSSVYGGGGGAWSNTVPAGSSIYGGGGGSGTGAAPPGTSIFGGKGAQYGVSVAGIPGGGGSCLTLQPDGPTYGRGARGEARIWVTSSRI